VLIQGQPAAVVGDLHVCFIPPKPEHPPTTFGAGSTSVRIGGRAALRIGDSANCGASIVSGATNVNVGG
jgi:uncharacterized Zn-binding protein involved in type VI secretion